MKPLLLTLREQPDQRLDLSPLVPHRLAGKTAAAIAAIALQTTRSAVTVGDVFRLRAGDVRQIRIEGACERLDLIGCEMEDGEIVVDGDVGSQAGRRMAGGRLRIDGNTGPWLGSGMTGGRIDVAGTAGERVGGPLPGEMAGMRGGLLVVRRDAGDFAGDRMRRGTIVIEGRAGDYAGSRMAAGTLVVRHGSGVLPGYLMRRGTIVLGDAVETLSPTFVDCGVHELLAMRLLAKFLKDADVAAGSMLRRPLRRFAGDMAVLGKGEIFLVER